MDEHMHRHTDTRTHAHIYRHTYGRIHTYIHKHTDMNKHARNGCPITLTWNRHILYIHAHGDTHRERERGGERRGLNLDGFIPTVELM
jgi:hypothetical protein